MIFQKKIKIEKIIKCLFNSQIEKNPNHPRMDPVPTSLRFGIDYEMRETELIYREQHEKMLSKSPKSIMNIDSINFEMCRSDFFYVQTHLDATVEYMLESESDVMVFFQRDWTKRGFLHTPYRMCIVAPGHGKYYCRVRSIGQLRKVLANWVE